MNHLLAQLARYGDIGWLSCQFAEFIAQQAGTEAEDPLVYTAALVCEANRNGDVCIDLTEYGDQPYLTSEFTRMPTEQRIRRGRNQPVPHRSFGTRDRIVGRRRRISPAVENA